MPNGETTRMKNVCHPGELTKGLRKIWIYLDGFLEKFDRCFSLLSLYISYLDLAAKVKVVCRRATCRTATFRAARRAGGRGLNATHPYPPPLRNNHCADEKNEQ